MTELQKMLRAQSRAMGDSDRVEQIAHLAMWWLPGAMIGLAYAAGPLLHQPGANVRWGLVVLGMAAVATGFTALRFMLVRLPLRGRFTALVGCLAVVPAVWYGWGGPPLRIVVGVGFALIGAGTGYYLDRRFRQYSS